MYTYTYVHGCEEMCRLKKYIAVNIYKYIYIYTLKSGMHLIVSMTKLSVVLSTFILATAQFLLLVFQVY